MKRRLLIAGLGTAGVFALVGCTQPTPGVTVWSGAQSVERGATCWSPDATVRAAIQQCVTDSQTNVANGVEIPTLTVSPGSVVGINVDPDVAEAGWRPSIGGQPLVQDPITTTYYRFTFPESAPAAPNGFVLSVVARGATTGDRGLWLFRIKPQIG